MDLSDFEIDSNTGFLPSRPLTRLPARFDPWENALATANERLSLGEDQGLEAQAKRRLGIEWRQNIENLPLISTTEIQADVRLLQRAHHVLAFLVHFYVHSCPPSGEPRRIPAAIAVPLVEVSKKLRIAPVLTFADTVLWNWELIDPHGSIETSNIRCPTLFTRLKDEEEFYIVSIAVELRSIEMVKLMRNVVNLLKKARENLQIIAQHLCRICKIVDELSLLVQGVRSTCRPHTFYHSIRPWFRGSDAQGGDSPGWIYEGCSRRDCTHLSGPSAGQSTSMHALDCFLNIDHELSEERLPAPSANNRSADTHFMERMRFYMPGPHREFLQFLKGHAIRRLAQSSSMLTPYYDDVVLAVKRFRDAHMRIAVLYIISMARTASHARRNDDSDEAAVVRGTGGTELAKLLKAGRDATIRTLLTSSD